MQINDTERRILVAYVRGRLGEGKAVLSDAELADAAGIVGGSKAVANALAKVGRWCVANGLPNIATAIISAENAEQNLTLPGSELVAELGGESVVRTEQARVRDFDWSHWAEG